MARQTGMKGLQLWCRNVTQGYEGVEIVNMNKSFRDGLAFCAIIHRYRPELIPYDTLVKGDVARNNTLAFKVADEELDIAPLLDVEDMVAMEIPDKLSIATYLITYYNYFKDKLPAVTGNAPPIKTTPPTNGNAPPNKTTPPTNGNVAAIHVQKETPSKPLPPPSQTTPTNDEAVNKLSKALANIQRKETDSGGYHGNKPAMPTAVKKPLVPTTSLDHTPSATPPSINKSVRGRKQKFTSVEPVATETNKPTTAPPPKPPSQRKSIKHKTVANETCDQCHEKVFIMQRLCAEGHTYHRQCFRCVRCDVGLQSKSYEYDIQGDLFYCRQHFQEVNRSRSIKRNMAARGVVDNEVGVAVGGVTEKERQEEWDIIPTPPPSQATPFEFPVDKEEGIQRNLPSLLSQLAQKKQALQRAESHPLPRPQGELKSPILPPSPVKSTNKVQTPPTSPNKTPPTSNKTPHTSSIQAPPTSPRHGNKYPLSPSKSHPVKPAPPPTVSNKRPHLHTDKPHPSGSESHPPNKPRPYTYKPRPPTTVTSSKQEVNKPRPLQDEPRPLQDEPRPLQDKPRPPKPVRQGSKKVNMTQVLEHYEMGPEFFKSNKEAREVLRERYDIPDAAGTTLVGGEVEECNPYEVPVPMVTKVRSKTDLEVKQPEKPQRHKRPGLVTIHKGDTWVRPYAVSPLHGGDKQEPVKPVISADKPVIKTNKPKPVRPAPPAPYVRKPKPVPNVSPYAVSNMSTSFANNELKRKRTKQLREYKRQIELIDADRKQLEMKGVELEQEIREGEEGGEEESEQQEVLMEQWFTLVNDKDQLVRRESELVYMIRDIELIDEKETLEMELRKRLAKDSSSKSDLERAEEDAMMEELMQLVMRRDQLMWQLDEDKTRDDEVDQLIDKVMK